MALEDEIPPFDNMSLTFDERRLIFGNVFKGTIIPDASAVFFDAEPSKPRDEIKGADVTIRGSDQPWQIVYGEVKIGGVVTFVTTDVPGGGEWLHMVTTLAGHKIKNVLAMFVDGVAVPFGTSGGNIYGWSTGSWAIDSTGYVFASLSDGAADQAANADLLAQGAILFPGIWTSAHRQRGRAHIYNIFYFSPEKFPNGLPELQYLVKGKADIYDPRSGGSYAYTQNAALIIADYLANTEFGLGAVYGTDIDTTNLAAAADICDEDVGLNPTGTEKRYTINGVIDTNEDPKAVLDKMQTAIGGPIVYQGGKWKIYPAAWRTPALSLNESDIVGPIRITTARARRDLFNGVKGTYLNSESWEIEDFPAVLNSFYESEDGEQILLDTTYPLTTSPATAQRLSKIKLERCRQAIEVQATFTLKAFKAQLADNVTLSLERLGWSSKEFEVTDMQLIARDETCAVSMTLQETAEGVFDWADGDETVGDLAPNTTLPDPNYVSDLSGLTLESGTAQLYTRQDGTVFSRVRVGWDSVVDPFVRNGGFIDVQARNDTRGESYRSVAMVPGDQTFLHVLDVRDGDTYSIRARAINNLNRQGDWIEDTHEVLGKRARPSAVSSVTGTPNETGILIEWPSISDADVSHYVIAIGDDRANMLRYSEALDNSLWTKHELTVEADDTTAPDSLSTAERLEESSATDLHTVEQLAVNVVNGSTYRVIAHLKADERSKARVSMANGGFSSQPYVDVDLSDGSQLATGGSPANIEIDQLSDGWVRVSFEATATEDHGNAGIRIYILNAAGSASYAGDGASGLFAWGLSFHAAAAVAKYRKTVATAATSSTRTVIAQDIRTTAYQWQIQAAGSYEINVVAYDTSGNEGIVYTSSTVTVSAPSAPLSPMAEVIGPDYNLSWLAPSSTQFTIEQYEIREGATVINRVKTTRYSARVTWSGSKTFSIFAVDIKGNIGVQADVTLTITAPSAVTGLRSVVVDNNVLLYFEEPAIHTLPIDHYRIEKSSAIVAESSRPFVNLFEVLGGIYTYDVIPVDSAENDGSAASLVVTVSQPPDFILNASGTIDPDDYDTFTNAQVAEDGASFYAPAVTGRTWAQHFTDKGYTNIQDFIDDGYTIWVQPSGSPATVERIIDLGVVLSSSIITSAINQSVLAGSESTVSVEIEYSEDGMSYTSGGAGNAAIFATEFQYIKITYTITAPDDFSISLFSAHTYTVQVKKQTDSGVVEVTANPTTVNFNLDFVDIQSVVGTAQGTTALIVVCDFVDVPNPTSFNVYLFDAAGSNASGAGKYVRWQAEGAVSPG